MLIGYGRVSTLDQNPDMQEDALKAAGCEVIHIEKASGSSLERMKLQAALNMLRKDDVLVVWKLDRLARSLKDLLALAERLKTVGAELRCLQDPIDTTTAMGVAFFQMAGTMAELEASLTRERVKEGQAAARRRGRTPGRPKAMDADKRRMVRALLLADEHSISEICAQAGVSRSVLYQEFPGGRSALLEVETS